MEMECRTFLVLLILVNISFPIKQTTNTEIVLFNGFDCREQKRLVSFLSQDWCRPEKLDKNALGEKSVAKLVTILQMAKFQLLEGIRCTKEATRFLVYCGSYSHMKLLHPPMMMLYQERNVWTCTDAGPTFIKVLHLKYIDLNSMVKIPMVIMLR